MGLAQLISLGLLGVLMVVYLWTHLAVGLRGLRRWKRLSYRGLAIAQVGGLTAIMLFIASRGFGHVG